MLPGEYKLVAGNGQVLVQNVSDTDVTLTKGYLLTRAITLTHSREICNISFSETEIDEKVNCGDQLTECERISLQKLLSEYGGKY